MNKERHLLVTLVKSPSFSVIKSRKPHCAGINVFYCIFKFCKPVLIASSVRTEYRFVFSGKSIAEAVLKNTAGANYIWILTVVFNNVSELLTHNIGKLSVQKQLSEFIRKPEIAFLGSLLYPHIPEAVIDYICVVNVRSDIKRIMRFKGIVYIRLPVADNSSGQQHSASFSSYHSCTYHMAADFKIILRGKILFYHLTHF